MLMHKSITAFAVTFATLACSLSPTQSYAATLSPVCKTVMDANDKQYTTPVHLYLTRSGTTNESIATGDAMYVKTKGNWRRSPITPKVMLEMRNDALKEAKSLDCRHLRDEAVNGESAAVYSMSNVTEDGRTDGQIWISRSRDLPLKSEMDVTTGADKTHTSIRYDYRNVQAPAGVK
ncbi:MAG: hypothetical protein ABI389_13990 [Rhodanobacter sp.]